VTLKDRFKSPREERIGLTPPFGENRFNSPREERIDLTLPPRRELV